MERLWNAVIPIAEKRLVKFKHFSPFAACMLNDGIIVRVPESSFGKLCDSMKAQQLVRMLAEQVSLKTIRGSCLCRHLLPERAELPKTKGSIHCTHEDLSGNCLETDLPYTLSGVTFCGLELARSLQLGRPSIRSSMPVIFAQSNLPGN